MNLLTPLSQIPGIGPVSQKGLKKLGLENIRDLFYHFPHRYDDFSKIISISQLKSKNFGCIQGKILKIENKRIFKIRMTLTQAIVEDKTGAIKVVWFNQPYLIQTLKEGENVCLAGKVSIRKNDFYLSNPIYEKVGKAVSLTHVGRIVPVYPETRKISSRWFRYILKPLLAAFKDKLSDPLPGEIVKKEGFLPLNRALWQIHFPDSANLAKLAQERFSFEELFFIELSVLKERVKLLQTKTVKIPLNLELAKSFVNSLPFKLTDSQKKSAWQILKDLEKPHPMNRLLEGDVGSGKTVVAAMATLLVAKAGYQVAFLAPTEILAKQHFQEIYKLLKDFKLSIALLTGKADKIMSKKLKNETIEISRKKLLEKTLKGEIDILIGTHALISSSAPKRRSYGGSTVASGEGGQDKVRFGRLALVIVDEQHRFGVEQRAKLCQQKEIIPHLLSMTATPIPRTLALTIYGDLDLSLITELPKGRKKIITEVVPPNERERAYQFIRKQVKKRRQVFVICPRIEPPTTFQENNFSQTKSTKSGGGLSWAEVRAVKEEYQRLSKEIFPDLKVGMLHGKMASKEKEKIMKSFKAEKIDILVSTSVVEVGIDVPNATVMMIEGTERFGLAQLHQFRGRVGRSHFQSYCFLFTDSPAKRTRQRLRALLKAEDGFELSQRDLEIRGPGAINGIRQWGIPDLVMSSLKDIFLVEKTRQAAKEILEKDPELKKYPLLRARLEEFGKRVHLE